ncbi:MAG: type IV pili twitching motility protein PilT [Alphaproteobacteria bacterium RIFCSPHIGHO2_12_FULL_45_9]|nr:MAG: type IV pili twitching motility protein PilT [Alphaproteobacteria bacterium RIFCSPHIGHO2_02_FULL_46_13]OFW96466.1 MAG: type IV pili twitching motility protein PilT [Alphaproteobacteria bacterium RIFCSPHIGHO2_12_FULL_45_9]
MGRKNATDLYLTIGVPPTMRIDDALVYISDKAMDMAQMNDVLSHILTTRQRRDFEMKMELNTAIDLGPHGRFRVNIFQQRLQSALVIRRIISRIPSFSELRLPQIMEKLALTKRGLILVTGMTGSGKTTTLASMIDYRNTHSSGHILTIEDPIEYFHDHKKSVITQREVGVDTESYAIALKNALRQRPDAILVGEIRDREVMEQALTAAETGHLCLSTIHTNNAYQAIERIVNMFPEESGGQIRNNLAMNLRAIISQRLIRTINGGLAVAMEVMLNEGLVRDLIVDGKISKISEVMGANEMSGMITFDQSLIRLYEEGVISEEMAISQSDLPSDMRLKIQKIKIGGNSGGLSGMDTSVLKISE